MTCAHLDMATVGGALPCVWGVMLLEALGPRMVRTSLAEVPGPAKHVLINLISRVPAQLPSPDPLGTN